MSYTTFSVYTESYENERKSKTHWFDFLIYTNTLVDDTSKIKSDKNLTRIIIINYDCVLSVKSCELINEYTYIGLSA